VQSISAMQQTMMQNVRGLDDGLVSLVSFLAAKASQAECVQDLLCTLW
jgi:hypothetical protein